MPRTDRRYDCMLCFTGSHTALAKLYYYAHLRTRASHRVRTGNTATYKCNPTDALRLQRCAHTLEIIVEDLEPDPKFAGNSDDNGNRPKYYVPKAALYLEKLRDRFPPHTEFTSFQAAQYLSISRTHCTAALRKLREIGAVHKHGHARTTCYHLTCQKCSPQITGAAHE